MENMVLVKAGNENFFSFNSESKLKFSIIEAVQKNTKNSFKTRIRDSSFQNYRTKLVYILARLEQPVLLKWVLKMLTFGVSIVA